MKLKTEVGQILLTHNRDQNFTSLYEEGFLKQGENLELYVTIEIDGSNIAMDKTLEKEFSQVSKNLVSAFKRTYISANQIDQDTFEKSLAAVNIALSKTVSKQKTHWFGKLNVALAAFYKNNLSLSVTGNAKVYLYRKGSLSDLAEGLSDESGPKPTKIFSNLAAGKLAPEDKIIISTNQLFNYLSMERVQEFLEEETLEETCKEMISALSDIRNIGFATFVFETLSPESTTEQKEKKKVLTNDLPAYAGMSSLTKKANFQKIITIVWTIVLAVASIIGNLASSLFILIRDFFKNRPKKYLIIAIAIVALLLVTSVATSVFKNRQQQKQEATQTQMEKLQDTVEQAESSLIFDDKETVLSLIKDAEQILDQIKIEGNQQAADLQQRIQILHQKTSKEVAIDNPTILASLPIIPTHLIHSPNGFLAFNQNTGRMAFYDLRNGSVKEILSGENTNNLIAGGYVGDPHGFVFLNNEGTFVKINIENDSLEKFESPTTALDMSKIALAGLEIFGSGLNARIYSLDSADGQIYRSQVQQNEITAGSAWVRGEKADSGSVDIAVDGGIYILFSDKIEKFFSGNKQGFSIDPVLPEMKNATKIFTSENHENIYIAEPENERILIFNKNGELIKQISSPKFRDLSDFYVNEAGNIIQAATGTELLKIDI